jgi:hypothetical protein
MYRPDRLAAICADDGVFPFAAEERVTDRTDQREDKVQ